MTTHSTSIQPEIPDQQPMSAHLGEGGAVLRGHEAQIEAFRGKIRHLRDVGDMNEIPRGVEILLIAKGYGWVWEDIPWGAYEELEEFLALNADWYRLVDLWMHLMMMANPCCKDYQGTAERCRALRLDSTCTWDWFRAARQRIEKYEAPHGKQSTKAHLISLKDEKYMGHYLKEAKRIEGEEIKYLLQAHIEAGCETKKSTTFP